MVGGNLYERLRREHRFYCMGKKPSGLKAACEYLEAILAGVKVTQREVAEKYGVTTVTVRNRYREIVLSLIHI